MTDLNYFLIDFERNNKTPGCSQISLVITQVLHTSEEKRRAEQEKERRLEREKQEREHEAKMKKVRSLNLH